MYYGPSKHGNIDGEIVDYNWKEKLQNNKHYKKFQKTIINSQVDALDLLKLERAINQEMTKNAQKYVENELYR